MKAKIETDAWKKICDDLGLSDGIDWFVSPTISSKTIGKYGRPEKLIPINTREQFSSQHQFLYMNKLTPMRVGKGEGILTKASLFQDIPRGRPSDSLQLN